uniref:MIF4G domain-containing protein n=1 Tax=Gouania willdenowi TaxID=441366 RepID=A0A8C5DFD8_GOUWI
MGPPPYSHGQLYHNRDSQDFSSGSRPVAPPHVYLVTTRGRFPFPRSAQRPIFFMAEYGPQLCMATPQQCPVPAGPHDGMDAPPPPQISAYPAPLPNPIPTNKESADTKEVEEEMSLPPSSTSNGVAQEEAKLTWKEKEDQLEAENIQPDSPQPTTPDKENQSKEEQRKPNAWKTSTNKPVWSSQLKKQEERDSEQTKDLLKKFRSILNKLTPEKFEKLMAQVQMLTIDTEQRLKDVIDLTFEKAISEPAFSEIYAKMCSFLNGLKVQSKENPECQADFRKLLLNRCQKEFEKDKDINEEKKQGLREERSVGNIKFVGELFKLQMIREVVMHDCITKLLKNHDDQSLEVLCKLLSTIGKDLDVKKEKHRVDQCFQQMEKIVKDRKTSSRIRFMMQDVLDLRTNNWVPRRVIQGPKTIDQIREQAKMEEQMEGPHHLRPRPAQKPQIKRARNNFFFDESRGFNLSEWCQIADSHSRKYSVGL